jgi:PleD family two-component response regulator
VRGILNKLGEIERNGPASGEFVRVLRDLARQFQFDAMKEILERPEMQPILERPISDIVLIVDDIPENLSLLHDALDESGYTVLVATNGESACNAPARACPTSSCSTR